MKLARVSIIPFPFRQGRTTGVGAARGKERRGPCGEGRDGSPGRGVGIDPLSSARCLPDSPRFSWRESGGSL
jgi:hypothetical protein